MEFLPDIFMPKHINCYSSSNNSSNMLKFSSPINNFSNNCTDRHSIINQTDLNQLIPSCSKDFLNQINNNNNNNVLMNQTFAHTLPAFTKSEVYTTNSNNIYNESLINESQLQAKISSLPSMILTNDDTNFQQHLCQLYGLNTTNYSQNGYAPYFAAAAAANFASTLNENQSIKNTFSLPANNIATTNNYLKPFTTFDHTTLLTSTINSTSSTTLTNNTTTTSKITNFNNLANLWPINSSQNFITNFPFTIASNNNKNKKSKFLKFFKLYIFILLRFSFIQNK